MNATTETSQAPRVLTSERWQVIAITIFFFIVSFATIGNVSAILVILKSNIRTTVTGHLLINQAVADIGFLVVCLVLMIFRTWYVTEDHDAIITFLVLVWFCVISAGAHSMAMVTFNLFLAICHYSTYKAVVTMKRVHIFILASWTSNALFLLLFFHKDQFMYYDHDYKKVMSNYSPEVTWIVILIMLNCPIIPFVTAVVSFAFVLRHTRQSLPSSLNINSVNRFRLSKMILLNSALFTLTYVFLLLAQTSHSTEIQAFTTLIHFSYHIAKLPLLFKFYPPLQQLMPERIRRRNASVTVRVDQTRVYQITTHA